MLSIQYRRSIAVLMSCLLFFTLSIPVSWAAIAPDWNGWSSPGGIVKDSAGRVIITAYDDHVVRIFNSDESLSQILGTLKITGTDNTHFNGPISVAIHPVTKSLYVLERGNKRIQVYGYQVATGLYSYSSTIALESTVTNARSITIDASGTIFVAQADNILVIFPNNTTQKITRSSALGAAGDGAGNLYISRYWEHTVEKYSLVNGSYVFQSLFAGEVNKAGNDSTHLNNPSYVFVGPDKKVYVTETGRTQVYLPNGNLAMSLKPTSDYSSVSVFADANEILVVDSRSRGVYRYDTSGNLTGRLGERHVVTYSAGSHGTLNGGTSEMVFPGAKPAAVPTVTANSGYTFTGWSSDGGTTLLTKAQVEATTVNAAITYTAYYKQNTHIVTYAAGSHGTLSGGTSETVNEGGKPTAVPTVTANSGYTFTGWSSNGGTTLLTKAQLQATTVTGAITYTAYYTQNKHVVSYAAGSNGTLSGSTSETVTEGSSPITVPTVTANSGYTFAGWSSDGGTTLLTKAQVEATTVTGAITYTAYYIQILHVVTYAPGAQGSLSGSTSETVAEGGSPAMVPTVTANSGYTFAGWSSDGGTTLLTKEQVEETTVTGAITYTAYYTQIMHVVTYEAGEHGTLSGETTETVAEGSSPVTVPTVTTNSGYMFAGWSSDGGATLLTKAQVQVTTVTSAITYTAYYTQNKHVVTYERGEHGTLIGETSETVAEGSSPVAVPTVTPNIEYTFAGWSSDGGTTLLTKEQVEATPVTGAITYTAYYTQITHVVTYEAGEHGTLSGGTTETVAEGSSPAAVPTVTANSGYTFAGWSSDGGVTLLTKTQVEAMPVNAAITYTAHYVQITHVVTYAPGAQGTLSGGTTETVAEGSSPAAVPTVTANSGYTFAGWSSDGGVTLLTQEQIEATPVNAAITYTAHYVQITHVVTYEPGAQGTLSGETTETVAEGGKPAGVPTVTANSGYTFAGWSSDEGVTLLTKEQVKATTVTSAITYTAYYTAAQIDGGFFYWPSTPTTEANVLINGKPENGGTLTSKQVNGQSVTTFAVDPKKLENWLSAADQKTVITIPVELQSDVVIGVLTGESIRSLEQKQAVLKIETGNATYTLPAEQININAISAQIGKDIALSDVKILISVGMSTASTVKVVENAAAKETFELVLPPLDFSVQAVYGDIKIDVTKFSAYVERTIAIPEGADPNKITTGVVVEPDGTVRHVPTKIIVIDGKYYAKVNSLTNSTYALVWHPVEFKDVAGHWAQKAVNDMGSRMVISGIGSDLFNPNQNITRAEFAEIIVRGLGLKTENGTSPFSDVKGEEWYASAIQTAYSYKLIDGFDDGTFRPADSITREQAIAILAKAMEITGLKAKLSAVEANELLRPFADADSVSKWAQAGMAAGLQAGIISGRTETQLAPKAFISRAEVAKIVQKLLQKSELI